MTHRREIRSPYMEWAKLRSGAKFNLAVSGMPNLPLSRLGVTLDNIEISGPGGYGYAPLQQALAAKCGVAAGVRRSRHRHFDYGAGSRQSRHLVLFDRQ